MLKPMVEVRTEGGTLVAEFWDCLRLDPAPVRDLRQHFEAHIRATRRADLVIDLNGVSFAGSAALGNFIVLHRLAGQHGGRLVFCKVDDNVREVFRVSKLESLFEFAPDRATALALLANSAEPTQPPPTALGVSDPPPSPKPAPPRSPGPLRRSRPRDENG